MPHVRAGSLRARSACEGHDETLQMGRSAFDTSSRSEETGRRRRVSPTRPELCAAIATVSIAALRKLPDLPGRVALRPQLFEVVLVAQRVHRLPEPVVPVGGELAL